MFQSSKSGPLGEIGEGGDIGETVTCLIPLPERLHGVIMPANNAGY